MHDWILSDKILLAFWPSYGGGKFVVNCLGFNDAFCPPLHMKYGDTKESYLSRRIPDAFKTIPPIDDLHNWVNYERRCGDLWGTSFQSLIRHDKVIPDITPFFKEILKEKYCFMFIHNPNILIPLQSILPNAKTLEITNVGKFYKIAIKVKKADPTLYGNSDLISPPPLGDFLFDMDNSVFSFDTFYQELKRCCEWLNVSADFDKRLREYYDAYMSIHSPTMIS
jgi:hypothetical protein